MNDHIVRLLNDRLAENEHFKGRQYFFYTIKAVRDLVFRYGKRAVMRKSQFSGWNFWTDEFLPLIGHYKHQTMPASFKDS